MDDILLFKKAQTLTPQMALALSIEKNNFVLAFLVLRENRDAINTYIRSSRTGNRGIHYVVAAFETFKGNSLRIFIHLLPILAPCLPNPIFETGSCENLKEYLARQRLTLENIRYDETDKQMLAIFNDSIEEAQAYRPYIQDIVIFHADRIFDALSEKEICKVKGLAKRAYQYGNENAFIKIMRCNTLLEYSEINDLILQVSRVPANKEFLVTALQRGVFLDSEQLGYLEKSIKEENIKRQIRDAATDSRWRRICQGGKNFTPNDLKMVEGLGIDYTKSKQEICGAIQMLSLRTTRETLKSELVEWVKRKYELSTGPPLRLSDAEKNRNRSLYDIASTEFVNGQPIRADQFSVAVYNQKNIESGEMLSAREVGVLGALDNARARARITGPPVTIDDAAEWVISRSTPVTNDESEKIVEWLNLGLTYRIQDFLSRYTTRKRTDIINAVIKNLRSDVFIDDFTSNHQLYTLCYLLYECSKGDRNVAATIFNQVVQNRIYTRD